MVFCVHPKEWYDIELVAALSSLIEAVARDEEQTFWKLVEYVFRDDIQRLYTPSFWFLPLLISFLCS
jgi:hypothetical protein